MLSKKNGAKYRCNKAKVVRICSKDKDFELEKIRSDYSENFVYKKGEIVEEKKFDENMNNVCTFFLS